MTSHPAPNLRRAAILAIPAIALACGGCQHRTRQDYVPTAAAAREALEKVLSAWQRGDPPGRIAGQPTIQIADTHRRAGQKLAGYEIAGELPAQEGRLFAVRVKLDGPSAEEKINFFVVGIDPLWVFRQEDYQMVTHWEHNMSPLGESAKIEAPNPKQ